MKIAVTTGDPAGIGPDVALLHTLAPDQGGTDKLVVLGDCRVLDTRARMLGLTPGTEWRQALKDKVGISVEHIAADTPVVAGKTDPRNAHHVLAQIDRGIAGCRNGEFDALVTGPVNKAMINEAGITFSGHTDYLARTCGCDTVMMLACDTLRVVPTTTHLPLSKVPTALTQERLERTLRIVHRDMRRLFGIGEPRIAVCGLNPHAGESGHLGREEIEVIRPVLDRLASTMHLTGPLPADTAFTPQQLSECDVVVTMYHDQGLPVIKHADFDNTVNVTLGLPLVRTSVDHGTALELAGTGRASARNLYAAINCASRLAQRLSDGGADGEAPQR